MQGGNRSGAWRLIPLIEVTKTDGGPPGLAEQFVAARRFAPPRAGPADVACPARRRRDPVPGLMVRPAGQ